MPELPDLVVYTEALGERLTGQNLLGIRIASPFLLRTVEPSTDSFIGKRILGFHLSGKRIVWEFQDETFLVFHLMIAGRFHARKPGTALNRKNGLASFETEELSLHLTEASSKKRASLHAIAGKDGLHELDRGGLDVLTMDRDDFVRRFRSERHTLKRTLTDPRLFSGIGNSYSDEILHHARLSPLQISTNLDDDELTRLFDSVRNVLVRWIGLLREQRGSAFPEKVTAFRPEMAVHGKYRQACPVCETPVQRIVYAENECNYCPGCQTGGRILADRSLSRLLKDDWPKTVEDLEGR